MPIPQLNFSTGNVVDPTRGALQGVSAARNTLSNTMNQWAKEEELDRQRARQKMLDDRATQVYNQQQQELTDRQKFGKAMLGDTQTRYADANSSDIMSLMKNVELTPEEAALSNKGIESPEVKAKLKAQMDLGRNFNNTGVRETEWEKAQRVARETGTGGSLGVQERLYGIKAADVAARNKKEADAKANQNTLLKKRDALAKEMRKYSVVEKGKLGGTSGSSGSSSSKLGTWSAEDAIRLDELADTFSLFGKGGDTEDVNKVITYARSIGLGPKQTESVIVRMGGGPEKLLSGEKMEIPGKPDATDAEIMAYAKSQLDAEAKKGYSNGTGGGLYNKKDNSAAINLLKAELNSVDKQLGRLGSTNYDAPEGSPEERSMDKMNSLAKKYWSEIPATGETPKKSGSSSKAVKKSSLIPGKIGAAMSSSTDGDVARLSLLPEFANEYENLTKPQQARVDKVLGSDASQKVLTEAGTSKEAIPKISTSTNLREALTSNKPLAQFPAQSELSPGALDILRQLNPTGMTDKEKMMAQFEAEDRPLEDMSLSFIPGLKAAKTTASQLKILTKAGYSKAKAEALIKSGRLKLLPERPSQINVPKKGFTNANSRYDISMPAMKP